MASWILLVFALIGAGLVYNAHAPGRGPKALLPSWIGVFLTTDLAWHHVALQIIVALIFYWLGAFDALPGRIAAVIMAVSAVFMLRLWLPNLKAAGIARAEAGRLRLDAVEPVPRASMLKPFARRRNGVEVIRDVEFRRIAGKILKLDVYRPDAHADGRPALLYIHGGGWMFGDKREQGIPLCNHMATLGWVCFNVNYRLSPGATWPDHLIDVKAAVAWVREHAQEYGIDPSFVAATGGSAGGHIAAMLGLTQGREELQPGFETADTTVQAVVPSYGAFDLTNRLGVHNPEYLTKMIGPLIIKAFPESEPERFAAASPRDFVANATQPWLILQGEADTLTPCAEARDFYSALKEAAVTPCGYAEFPGAAHAFDIYYSPRANAAVNLTARFLMTVSSRR